MNIVVNNQSIAIKVQNFSTFYNRLKDLLCNSQFHIRISRLRLNIMFRVGFCYN